MSLTATDLSEIRNIVESAATKQTNEVIQPIQNEIKALRSDVKEIYGMIAKLPMNSLDKQFN